MSSSAITLIQASVFNSVVTGVSYYLLETKLNEYSPWQKAAIASAVGTVSLGIVITFLSGAGGGGA